MRKRRISKNILEWRKRQSTGKIMRPSTFQKIVKKNIKKVGKVRATKIAGKAYWTTVLAKARKLKKLGGKK